MKKLRKDWLAKLAEYISYWAGSRYVFIIAIGLLGLWGFAGQFFDYSNGWQLVLTIGAAVITFLMVFIIQTTQNRNAKIIRIKLDELIRNTKGANNMLIGLEEFTEEELEAIREKYEAIAEEKRTAHSRQGSRGIVDVLFNTEIDRTLEKKPVIRKK
jgi:low affinity Fe/Cu permease